MYVVSKEFDYFGFLMETCQSMWPIEVHFIIIISIFILY